MIDRNVIYKWTDILTIYGYKVEIDIIPADTVNLSTPTVINLSSDLFDNNVSGKGSLQDYIFGLRKPESMTLKVNLLKVDSDLRDILLNPHIRSSADKFFSYDAQQEMPDFTHTNIWKIKIYDGANLIKYFVGGVRQFIEQDIDINLIAQTQYIEVELTSISHLVLENILPDHIYFYFLDKYENDTIHKTTNKIYDFIYTNDFNLSNEVVVKGFTNQSTFDPPPSTTVNGVTYDAGEKIAVVVSEFDESNPNNSFPGVYIFTSQGGQFNPIFSKVEPGEILKIDNVLYSVHFESVLSGDGILYRQRVYIKEFGGSPTKIISKYDSSSDGEMIFFKIIEISNAIADIGTRILRKYLREDTPTFSMNDNLLRGITFYKQGIKINDGGQTFDSSNIYFMALLKVTDYYASGYLRKEDDSLGIYEYSNIKEFLNQIGKSKARYIHCAISSTDTVLIKVDYKGFHGTAKIADISKQKDNEITITKNAKLLKDVTLSPSTYGDNKSEYIAENIGSFSDNNYSEKSVFHTMPTFDESMSYVTGNDDIEVGHTFRGYENRKIDKNKLIYFDNYGFTNKEIALLPDFNNIVISGINTYQSSYEIRKTSYDEINTSTGKSRIIALIKEIQKNATLDRHISKALLSEFSMTGSIQTEVKLPYQFLSLLAGDRLSMDINEFAIHPVTDVEMGDSIILKNDNDYTTGESTFTVLIQES